MKLDTKFVEGMKVHLEDWGGPVRCVLWRRDNDIPFGKVYDPKTLPFELIILDQGAQLPQAALNEAAVAMLSADLPHVQKLALQIKTAAIPFLTVIEYTFATRIKILWLEKGANPLRLLRSSLWLLMNEHGIRKTIKSANGLQCNGYPAFESYAPLCENTLLYLDNRMMPEMLAQPSEIEARIQRLRAGAPLRLIHSGRLETIKGSQDLPALMQHLRSMGVDATLDIYGAGRLADPLRQAFEPFGDTVRLHSPVDFETELVPINRTSADIFVSCHRQQDPSCTYLEAMGCGLAIAGYDNQMWHRLQAVSGAGRVAALGDPKALATAIAGWNTDRDALIAACQTGLNFAKQHDFQSEFRKRMDQARDLIAAASGNAASSA